MLLLKIQKGHMYKQLKFNMVNIQQQGYFIASINKAFKNVYIMLVLKIPKT